MATYYLALAFDTSTATDPQTDGTHRDAQYGFGQDVGNGVTVLGSGSGSSGRQFEAVSIPARTNGQSNAFAVAVFTNVLGIAQDDSFVRIALRPAHDVTPQQNPPTSPLNPADTQKLLTGINLSAASQELTSVNTGNNYGLPGSSFYSTQWLFTGYTLTPSGPGGGSYRYELTAEIAITLNGTPYYFKVDPEMMIDF